MDERRRLSRIIRVATVSLLATVAMVVLKLVAAWLSGSISVLAESVQSLLDVALSGLALWTIRVAAAPPDEDHPFGHGKAELLLSAFQMILVILVSAGIAWGAALRLHDPKPIKPDIGMVAMIYALISNAYIIHLLRRTGREESSSALIGEAEHLRSDSLASAGILVGLLATRLTGWYLLDPLVAIIFTLLGAFFAVRQLLRLLHPLMDGALPVAEVRLIEQVLDAHKHVRGFHNLRTREAGHLRVVSLHILLDDDLTFVEAHDLAEEVEDHLSKSLGGALVTAHYEPYHAELAHRATHHPNEEPGAR